VDQNLNIMDLEPMVPPIVSLRPESKTYRPGIGFLSSAVENRIFICLCTRRQDAIQDPAPKRTVILSLIKG